MAEGALHGFPLGSNGTAKCWMTCLKPVGKRAEVTLEGNTTVEFGSKAAGKAVGRHAVGQLQLQDPIEASRQRHGHSHSAGKL